MVTISIEAHPLKRLFFRDIKEVFKRSDEGSKGYLNKTDLKVAYLGLLGYKPSKFELEQIKRTFDFETRGMTETEFIKLMSPRLAKIDCDDWIRGVFLALDRSGNGYISLRDLSLTSSQLTSFVPSYVIERCFAEVDTNGDGKVGFREFDIMMKRAIRENAS
ncbi:EF-hand calcium-binding domain-containing protein 11 [Dinochytrium kinnereticum]|nr:EF-hand calcium-binding domain-containing protein 11 [Dinochytrium kinnereticum]